MCAIAYGLKQHGHDVRIIDVPDVMRESNRWQFFSRLHGTSCGGIAVNPAESGHSGIGIKCSVGCLRDRTLIKQFDLLVAHEFDAVVYGNPRLLTVPFLIHDRVISGLIEMGLFEAFLLNNVDQIRLAFSKWKPRRLLGFCGANRPERRAFLADAPSWADIRFYNTHPMSGVEHASWLCQFKGGLCLRGDTPHTNLPPLLALLGIATVMEPINDKTTPPFDDFNTIPFESWEQVKEELEDESRLRGVVEYATSNYVDSWSPMGQARLIAEAIG